MIVELSNEPKISCKIIIENGRELAYFHTAFEATLEMYRVGDAKRNHTSIFSLLDRASYGIPFKEKIELESLENVDN